MPLRGSTRFGGTMSRRPRVEVVAVCAAILMLALAGTAYGGQWRFGREAITGTGEITIEPRSSGITNRCRITYRGMMTTAPFSTTGPVARVGTIESAEATECTQARPRFLVERFRPWSVTYQTFSGSLPTASVLLLRVEEETLLFERFGEAGLSSCLYTVQFGYNFFTNITRETFWTYEINTFRTNEQTYRGTVTLAGRCPTPSIGSSYTTEETVTLRGVFADPSPAEFGRVATESLTQRSVRISASDEITVRAIGVERGNYFAITDPNRCIGARLAAGATCTFKVIFAAPGEAGGSFEDKARIETSRENTEDTLRAST